MQNRGGSCRDAQDGSAARHQVSLTGPSCAAPYWSRTYGGTGNERGFRLLGLPDDGVLLTGHSTTWGPFFGHGGLAARLDASGGIAWQPSLAGQLAQPNGLLLRASGDMVAAMRMEQHGHPAHACSLAPDGSWRWQRCFQGTRGVAMAMGVDETPTGGLVVACQVEPTTTTADLVVLELDTDGHLVSQVPLDAGDYDRAGSVVVLADGGLLVAGRTPGPARGVTDPVLVRLDASGNIAWQRRLVIEGGAFGPSLSVASNGDVWAVMQPLQAGMGVGGLDAWMVRLDASGRLDASCDLVVDLDLGAAATTVATRAFTHPAGTTLLVEEPRAVPAEPIDLTLEEQCTGSGLHPVREVSPPCSQQPLRVAEGGRRTWEDAASVGATSFNLDRGRLDSLSRGAGSACLLAALPVIRPLSAGRAAATR